MRYILIALLAGLFAAGCSGGGGGNGDVTNRDPVADAGIDQTVAVGSVAALTGAGSDPDGDALTYQWSFISKPSGSSVVLSSATSATASFTPDVKGTYTVQLVVTDSVGLSASDSVVVTAPNRAPTVDAGTDRNVTVGSIATLPGSATDLDGDALTYQWSFVSKPSASAAALASATSATASFTPDVKGTYTVEFTVADSDGLSASDSIVVTAPNRTPTADAGTDQLVAVSSLATLSGSGTDPDGDSLTYQWSFTSMPSGSAAVLASPTSATASFTPDVKGTFTIQFTVTDSAGLSASDSLVVTAPNRMPTANAGANQLVAVGSVATLPGSGTDPDGDSLTYQWSFRSKPSGSSVALVSATSATASFTPDVNGEYELELQVTDGDGGSASTVLSVLAATPVSGGIKNADVTLDATGSPYLLLGDVQVAHAAMFTVSPGVHLYGQGHSIQAFGILAWVGSADARITLQDVHVVPGGSVSNSFFMDIQYVDFVGGAFYEASGQAIYGSFTLTHSTLQNLPEIYVWYPVANVTITHNTFCLAGNIIVLLNGSVTMTVENNRFSSCGNSQQSNSSAYAIESLAVYSPAQLSVKKNTFADTSRYAIALPNGYTSNVFDATDNYWSTTVDSVIQSMIFDQNDDLNSGGTVPYDPYLSAPDPGTP